MNDENEPKKEEDSNFALSVIISGMITITIWAWILSAMVEYIPSEAWWKMPSALTVLMIAPVFWISIGQRIEAALDRITEDKEQ